MPFEIEHPASSFGSFRRWENAHIALWLVKDTCWLLDFKAGALLMAGPTISLALWITWRLRASRTEFVHNLAVVCWICGNIVWMLGEFFYNDTWRPYAKWFFFIGLAVVGQYYVRAVVSRPRKTA